MVQELLQRGCLGQELVDHLAADVWRMFQPELAKDLGLDGLKPEHLALFPPHARGALANACVLHLDKRNTSVRGHLAYRWEKEVGLVTGGQFQGNDHQTQQKVIP